MTYASLRKPRKQGLHTHLAVSGLHTHLAKTRLGAGIIVDAASWAALTADTVGVTPKAKLATIALLSRIAFLTGTLPWPLAYRESNDNDLTGRSKRSRAGVQVFSKGSENASPRSSHLSSITTAQTQNRESMSKWP